MEIALAGTEPLDFDLKAIDGLTAASAYTPPAAPVEEEVVEEPTFDNFDTLLPEVPVDPGAPAPAAPPAPADPGAGDVFGPQ
jgi:hypothetical protein